MKFKNSLFSVVLMMLLFGLGSATIAQSDYKIYFQSDSSIYAIDDLSDEPTLIVADIPQTVTFSNSGHYAAYYDADGVWLTPTASWSPQKILSSVEEEAFSLNWTPDDTRLIMRLAFWPDEFPIEQPLAYNLVTELAEPWIWGECNQIVKHIPSDDFAIICETYENIPEDLTGSISLSWGSEFAEYDPDEYMLLRDGILDYFPRPFDWGTTQTDQSMVYMFENPDYFLEIISLWSDDDNSEVVISGQSEFTIEPWFAVSDDRSMVAYSVFCGNPSDSCLQISELETNQIIWSYEDTTRMATVDDIEWYPDNRRVALLGFNADNQQSIEVFDVETGATLSVEVEDTTGVIVVD